MSDIKKSDIIRDVLQAIIDVTGRRTFDSYIVMIITTVLEQLKKNYSFLQAITINDELYSEHHTLINVSNEINSISFAEMAEAIQQIFHEVYLQLEDDAGLYFIKEITEHLGDEYVQTLKSHGVDFDNIQKDQHLLYSKKQRKHISEKQPLLVQKQKKQPASKQVKKQKPALTYAWKDVSTWKYNNNVCTLYKSDGSLLDKLELDYLVEDYINRYTTVAEDTPFTSTMVEISKKEYEFLETLYSRDLDIDMAMVLLHISKPDIDEMVQKFLSSDILEYINDNEVKLTRKGILFLLEHTPQTF